MAFTVYAGGADGGPTGAARLPLLGCLKGRPLGGTVKRPPAGRERYDDGDACGGGGEYVWSTLKEGGKCGDCSGGVGRNEFGKKRDCCGANACIDAGHVGAPGGTSDVGGNVFGMTDGAAATGGIGRGASSAISVQALLRPLLRGPS